jgi:prepilin-type N-terminal cleavage/methylation domain-containing protein
MIFLKNDKGYTLVELLAVMVILVAVGMIITSIMVSSLRGGGKSLTTNDIRQNGDYAISQMSKMIAYAKSFNGVYNATSSTWTDCVGSSPTDKYDSVRITSFDEGTTIFNCANMVLSSNSAALVNPDLDAACYFTCSQDSLSTSPTINLYLTLKKRQATGFTLLPEAQTIIDFHTSVTLRNNLIEISNP